MRRAFIPVVLLACLFLAGCQAASVGDVRDTIAAPTGTVATLATGETVGQTFVARHAGLSGVDLYLARVALNGDAALDVRLRESALPGAAEVRVASIQLTPASQPGWQHVSYAPLADSHNRSFYLQISGVLPSGSNLELATAPGDTYNDGSLYLDSRPVDGQLSAGLDYSPGYILANLLGWLAEVVVVVAAVAWLLLLPGLALQQTLLPLPGEDWKTRLGLATGLGLSIYAPLFIWAKAFGIAPGALVVVAVPSLSLVVLGWVFVRRGTWRRGPRDLLAWWHSPLRWPDVIWVALLALVVLVRLFLLRGTDAPMWGDSVQHATISQLIYEHGGLFDSWNPYAPYATLTVHPAFHITTALFMWLLGKPVLQATLLSGQLINALGILTLVPLAARMLRSNWAGLGVVLVAGLVSPLPNGYLNWGRYPQLMGQAILPVALWLVWWLVYGSPERRWGVIVACALSAAGAFLAYYRTPHAIVAFALVALVAHALTSTSRTAFTAVGRHTVKERLCRTWSVYRYAALALFVSACLALAVMLPWLLHLRGSTLGDGVDASTAGTSSLSYVLGDYLVFGSLGPALLSTGLVLLCCAVIVWSVVCRRKGALVIAAWGVVLMALPTLRLLPIPGINNEQAFAVLVGMYIPIGLLVGYAVDVSLQWSSQRVGSLAWASVVAVLITAALGARGQLGVLDPNDRMLAPADLRALDWARAKTPPDANFLVDGFLIYDGHSAVGSDGGWYVPLLARRRSTMPPQYPLLAERPDDPQYNQMVVDVVAGVRAVGVTSPEGIALLCRYGITHVYVGQEQGHIGVPAPQPMLSLAELEQSVLFDAVYRQDKVGIFALHPSACR